MYWLMILQFIRSTETLWTFTTNIRLQAFVSLHVYLKHVPFGELLLTNVTREPFDISRVDSQVMVKVGRLTKRLVTHVTFVQFLSAVNSAVHRKIACSCEVFTTNTTFKWFLSQVTARVHCQIVTISTTSATLRALVFVCMNIHMATQGAFR